MTAMSNLKRLEPYVRREMGQRVRRRLGERSVGQGAEHGGGGEDGVGLRGCTIREGDRTKGKGGEVRETKG